MPDVPCNTASRLPNKMVVIKKPLKTKNMVTPMAPKGTLFKKKAVGNQWPIITLSTANVLKLSKVLMYFIKLFNMPIRDRSIIIKFNDRPL